VEAYARRALKLIDGLAKTANEIDEGFQKREGRVASDAHAALAMVCMQRDDSGKPIEEFAELAGGCLPIALVQESQTLREV
jgi:hypothetical protein